MTAWINAFVGIVLVFAITELKLGLTLNEGIECVAASNAAGLISLLLYTAASHYPWSRRHLVNGPARTWALFLVAYFGLLLGLAPALREPRNFGWLVFPAVLSTGFAIVAFGPLRDWLIARPTKRR